MQAPKVNLTKMAKVNGKWQRYPVVLNSNGSVKPGYILLDGRPMSAPEGNYMLDWYENGKRVRLSVGQDASEALNAKQRKEAELAHVAAGGSGLVNGNGNGNGTPSKTPLKDAIAKFLEAAKLEKSKKTHQAYRTALLAFQHSCHKIYVQDIEPMDLSRFKKMLEEGGIEYEYTDEKGNKQKQTMKPQSERSVYNKREIVTYLLKANKVFREDGSPILKGVDREKPVSDKHKAYSREEIEAIFGACNETERTWFKFFLLTGMREQEVIFQTWDNIDFRNRVIHVRDNPAFNYKLKTKKSRRDIPMGESLSALLKAWKEKACKDCALVFPTSGCRPKLDFLDCLKRVAKKAKVKRVTLHKFRATYASWLHRSGTDARTIQELLGHTELETTQLYLSIAEGQEMKSKVNALETYAGV